MSAVSDDNAQKLYTLKGRSDRLLRNDLLKVEDVQRHASAVVASRRGTFKQEELREDLKPYINRLKEALFNAPDRKMYTSEAAKVLRVVPGFTDLSAEFPSFVALLRIFPELEVTCWRNQGSEAEGRGGANQGGRQNGFWGRAHHESACSSASRALGGPALLSYIPEAVHRRLRTKSAWQNLHLLAQP